MAFIQEKVVVVELDGVDAVLLLEKREDFGGALGRLGFLPAIENRHNAAELAAKWTTDACVVHRSAAAQEGGQQVALDRSQLVIRKPRKVIGRAQMPFCVVNVEAEVVLERKAVDARQLP